MSDLLRGDVDYHQKLLVEHIAKFKIIEEHIEDSKVFIDSASQQLSEIKAELCKLPILEDSIKSQAKMYSGVQNDLSNFKDNSSKLKSSLESQINNVLASVDENLGKVVACVSAIEERVSQQTARFKELSGMLANQELSLNNLILEFEKKMKEWTENRISEIKIPDVNSLLDSFKSEVSKKLDLIAVECQNALLKAGNIATQIPMIDKRIENLYLSLQKIEISQKR